MKFEPQMNAEERGGRGDDFAAEASLPSSGIRLSIFHLRKSAFICGFQE
jgi:hypothetical protein